VQLASAALYPPALFSCPMDVLKMADEKDFENGRMEEFLTFNAT